LKEFRKQAPDIHVRVSTMNEREIEDALLRDVARLPMILYERGSTGRQHVLDAFHERGLTARVALETTSTETIVSMVQAGLGVSIVPLLSNGLVTRRRRVEVWPLVDSIRSIHSGIYGDEATRQPAPRLA
jgi:DNA-binding transcriptional LysR family regulator